MYKVQISFSTIGEETYGFMFNKDGYRNMTELPCSVAKRWGHKEYALEAGLKSFLDMYGSEIGSYTVGDIEYCYEEGRLVNAYYYVTFDKLPESLADFYEEDLEDPYSYLEDEEEYYHDEIYYLAQVVEVDSYDDDESNLIDIPFDKDIDEYPMEPELPSEDPSSDEYPNDVVDYNEIMKDMSQEEVFNFLDVPEEDRAMLRLLNVKQEQLN